MLLIVLAKENFWSGIVVLKYYSIMQVIFNTLFSSTLHYFAWL